jgi:hypothetical protein
MAHQRRADLAIAGDDVDHAGREYAFAQFAEPEARQRRLFGALDDHGIAGGERSGGFLGAKPERVVERIDLGDDAERLSARQVEMTVALRERLALDLGDEARAIAQPVGGPDHVTAHADDSVAGIDRIEQRELVRILFDTVRQKLEAACAFLDRYARPLLEARLGRLNSRIDIRFIGGRNVGKLFHI